MRSDDLTREQCAAIRVKASEMVHYLAMLQDRMNYKGFPASDPVKVAVENALAGAKKLHSETLTRSIGVKAAPEPKQPPVDLLFTRTSKPRRHETH